VYKIHVKQLANGREAIQRLGRTYLHLDIPGRGSRRVKQGQSITLSDELYNLVAKRLSQYGDVISVTHWPSAQLAVEEPTEEPIAEVLPVLVAPPSEVVDAPADEAPAVVDDVAEEAVAEDAADDEPISGEGDAPVKKRGGRRGRRSGS